MRQNSNHPKESAEQAVKDIRRQTRRRYSPEERIRIVLEGLRGEDSIAELCRKEGINPNLYYRWSKEFLEAGKKRLAGDTAREATSDEVKALRAEMAQLKEAVAVSRVMQLSPPVVIEFSPPSQRERRDSYVGEAVIYHTHPSATYDGGGDGWTSALGGDSPPA